MTLKVNFKGMDAKLKAVIDEIDRAKAVVMRETAEQAIKTIVRRTRQKSQDFEGKSFRPYSSAYAKQKQKAGASTKVNLTSTGQRKSGGKGSLKGNRQGGTMLNSLTIIRVEDDQSRFVIGAARRPEQIKLARHVRGSGSLPKRNPLGFTSAEEKLLVLRAVRQFKAKIRKIGQN